MKFSKSNFVFTFAVALFIVPARMIGQLEQSMSLMKSVAAGDHSDPNGYDIDMVQQRYALALTYAIMCAREGFK